MAAGRPHVICHGVKMSKRDIPPTSTVLPQTPKRLLLIKGVGIGFWGNDRGYEEVFEAAHPEITKRTFGDLFGPLFGPFPFLYKNDVYIICGRGGLPCFFLVFVFSSFSRNAHRTPI